MIQDNFLLLDYMLNLIQKSINFRHPFVLLKHYKEPRNDNY